jgi:3-hydroxyacyl-CoA dehydrogenase/enoyl-CoA hydratase/3-hydroxybutyryl-CoA epimerase
MEQFVLERLEGKPLARRRAGFLARLRDRTRLGQRLMLWAAGRRTAAPGRHYPALPAILSAVERGLRYGREQGLASERAGFAELLFTPACRNLMGLFFQRERARKPGSWLCEQGPAARPVRRVAVIGAGVMGAGIAQLAAYNGLKVVLKDVNQEILARGLRRIEDLMEKAKRKGLLSAEEAATRLKCVSTDTSWDAVADVDLAVEAVPENEDLKREVFRQLGERLSPEALIVSNTSSLSIGRLAEATRWPARVAGLHFFNPVHRMQLVEIVRHSRTSDTAVAALVSLVRRLGKVPMIVADRPGFLVNRVLFPYLDEAVRLLCEGAAPQRVDRSARDFGMPMGPLELLDQVGIDVAADIAAILAALAPEPGPTIRFLTQMAARGWTGTKAGRGIYHWRRHGRRGRAARWDRQFLRSLSAGHGAVGEASSAGAWRDQYQRRLICALVLAAIRCVEEHVVAEPWMVDLGMVLGTGFAPFRGGPLRMADRIGLDRLVLYLEELQRTCGPRFSPCELLREMGSRGARFYPEEDADEPATLKESEIRNPKSETILNHRK